jgi:cytochrome c oxidase cbb3-type subunit 3
MYSHCLPLKILLAAALLALPGIAVAQSVPGSTAVSTLFPGGGSPPPPDPRGQQYDHNPKAIADGARLFDWYNCSGCHFHGAGGIGPALMDDMWIYGGSIDQIFASIYQGRPNGMPSWAHKLPENEMWEIAAYVRSLSTPSAANGPGQLTPQTPPPPATAQPGPTPQTSVPDSNK